MKALLPIAAALLTSACWTPGPGQVDPTRYPWDQPRTKPNYCIVSLENPAATGIVARGRVPTFEEVPPGQLGAVHMPCKVTPNGR